MEKVIKKLVELQKVDNQLDKLRAKRGDLPERLTKLKSHSAVLQGNIDEDNSRVLEINKQLRQLATEIGDVKVKLGKYKDQLYLVTTNKEYDALQHEMDSIKEIINQNENTIIELEDEKIEIEERIKRNSISLDNVSQDLAKSTKDLEKALTATMDEEKKLEPVREKIISEISPSHLFTYNRFRKARNGKGIVMVKRNACGSCFNQLPPQTVIEVKKMVEFVSCPNCGMYLYWEE